MTDLIHKLGDGEFAVAAEYLIALQELTSEQGMSPQASLEGAGLPFSALIRPEGRIGHLAFERVVKNVLARFFDPGLAIEYGKRLSISKHGALGFAAQNSANLKEAVKMMIQFINIRTGGVESFELITNDANSISSLRMHFGSEKTNNETEVETQRFQLLAL